jgi:hypothetical protein
MRALLAAAAVALLGAGAPAAGTGPQVSITFAGRWEVARHIFDGRASGASARTFHPGDTAKIVWRGSAIDVYGITGPTGGYGVLVMRGQRNRVLNFYSPVKHAHVLLCHSASLPFGDHYSAIVAVTDHDPRSRGTYLNIDEIDSE